MKFTNLQHKTVSLIVLATFVSLLYFSATPAPAATRAGNSETAIAPGDSGAPSFIEEEGTPEGFVKKPGKFPWLIVGLGVVAVGAALYFLVIKKPKYTLTVTLDANCTGTPAATGKYTKGTVVNYNYTAPAGYLAQVKLDGVDVLASGTVTMDKDHAITVTSARDIRGAWTFNFKATNIVKNWSWTLTFTGDGKSGIFTDNFGDKGTYTITGNTVTWRFNTWDISGTGTFTGVNTMAGTATFHGVLIGGVLVTAANWTAIHSGATAFGTASAASVKTKSGI